MTDERINAVVARHRHTGWAILAAFAVHLALLAIYAVFFGFLLLIGAHYDRSGTWKLPAILFIFLPSGLAGYGAVFASCRMFKSANCDAVFYAFATGTIAILIAVLSAGNDHVVRNIIQTVLVIVGAWIAAFSGSLRT